MSTYIYLYKKRPKIFKLRDLRQFVIAYGILNSNKRIHIRVLLKDGRVCITGWLGNNVNIL